ncbi:DUF4145 domain-containing protein [Candidatus Woesearchaeota archaeon]|nr:DUF4145 domain-containing protein [Candidatus Woesearchaeota archaeon]
MTIRSIIQDVQDALRTLDSPQKGDFGRQREAGARMMLSGALKRLLAATKNDPAIYKLAEQAERASSAELKVLLGRVAGLVSDEKANSRDLPRVPSDVQEAVNADLQEVERCLHAECYRSAVILCGRVLETALHRKYFDATGQDLLEKAPGTGLGNLIAKLAEKGVQLDPGLPNQIHLINQVRVFSVHTKQQAFVPSKMQTEAIVLYTLDVLEKLFKK